MSPSSEASRPGMFQELPDLLLQRIMRGLDAGSLAAMSCTCTELKALCSEEWLWKELCLHRWKHRGTELWRTESSAGTYRALYNKKIKVSRFHQQSVELKSSADL